MSFHETLVKHLFDGVYFVDLDRRIQYWNKGAELLSGYAAEQMVGKQCQNAGLNHVDENGTHLCQEGCPLAASAADGQNREVEVYMRHAEGHRVPVKVRAAPVRDTNGELIGVVEVFSDNSEKKQIEKSLEKMRSMAYLDELTSLPNRRMLQAELEIRQSAFERNGWAYGLIMIDIDFFKRVNDQHGHDVGDRVIKMVGDTLRSASRLSDVVGRWGGEEFIALVTDVDPATLRAVGERYRSLVEASAIKAAEPLKVTISAGAAIIREGQGIDEVIKDADELLYRAKEQGRNRLVTAD